MRLVFGSLLALILSVNTLAEDFHFVALGDTDYHGSISRPAYLELIERINAEQPEFSIHVGDLWGAANCTDEQYLNQRDIFDLYDHPVFYTPGDNEWTDCNRYAYGEWNNVERLNSLRDIFFGEATSLGSVPREVVRQSDVSPYTEFVENGRWVEEGVLFVTLHVVGSFNNLQIQHESALKESLERNQANIAWIRDSVRIARENDLVAIVFAMQAEILDNRTAADWLSGSWRDIVSEIQIASRRFDKQILVIHGDLHKFVIDRPFVDGRTTVNGKAAFANITRLQVFGDPEIRAVRVGVDTSEPWVFSFEPLYVQ